MIEKCIEDWHAVIRGDLEGLDALLAEDVVFYSPVVFTPQKGKEITKLYLTAAAGTFGGSDGGATAPSGVGPKFHYTKEVLSGHHAVLEFETEVEGKHVNGVDIITCNGEGKIVEFRVMVRPLQAMNVLHQQMATMLEKLKGGAPARA